MQSTGANSTLGRTCCSIVYDHRATIIRSLNAPLFPSPHTSPVSLYVCPSIPAPSVSLLGDSGEAVPGDQRSNDQVPLAAQEMRQPGNGSMLLPGV